MSNIIKSINQTIAALAVVLIFIMMISISADVCLRYFANKPIVGTLEFNRTLLVLVVFFSLGYAQLRKRHINVEALLTLLPRRWKLLVEILESIFALVIIGFIAYGCFLTAYQSTLEGEYEMGIISFPMWPGRIAIALGLAMLCLQYLVDIIEDSKSFLKE